MEPCDGHTGSDVRVRNHAIESNPGAIESVNRLPKRNNNVANPANDSKITYIEPAADPPTSSNSEVSLVVVNMAIT